MNSSHDNKNMNTVIVESETTNVVENVTPSENKDEQKSSISVVINQDQDNDGADNDIPNLVDDDGNIVINNEDDNENNNNNVANSSGEAEPGHCPFAENCPVKLAMDNHITPGMVRHDPNMRDHINAYHSHLNDIFDNRINNVLNEIGFIHYILNTSGIVRNGILNVNMGGETGSDENEYNEDAEDKKNRTCGLCSNYYDHDEHSKFFLSCCAHNYCIKCVYSLHQKQEKCPKCHYSLEYLQKEIKLLQYSDKKQSLDCGEDNDSEDCLVCCEKLNSTQHNGEVVLECPCKIKMCITCAYRSLTDTKHVKMGEVQGIPGLILPQNYVVKGCCPTCRQIPANKDEIIMLYGFLPPRL